MGIARQLDGFLSGVIGNPGKLDGVAVLGLGSQLHGLFEVGLGVEVFVLGRLLRAERLGFLQVGGGAVGLDRVDDADAAGRERGYYPFGAAQSNNNPGDWGFNCEVIRDIKLGRRDDKLR